MTRVFVACGLKGPFFAGMWALLLCLLALLGCARDPLPGLIELTGISTDSVEAHADWSVLGRGFPPRRPVTVTLRGKVYAPGQKPSPVTLRLARHSDSRTRIALAPTPEDLARLAGDEPHVTFRGEIQAEFAPVRPGGPPLGAVLSGVVFDVHVRGATRAAAEDVSAFLAHVGLELGPLMTVTAVHVGSPAEAAGVQAGDVLVELDDVRLSGKTDVLPRPGRTLSVLKVFREGERESLTLLLDRRGYSRPHARFANQSVSALVAATVALIFSLRPPRLFVWMLSGLSGARSSGSRTRGRPSYALLLALSLLLDFWVFRLARERELGTDAALLFMVGLFLSGAALVLAPGPLGRPSALRSLSVALAFSLSLGVGAAIGLAQLGGLSFAIARDAEPFAFPLTQNPWSLFAGLSFLGALCLAATWLNFLGKRSAPLGRLGLVVLSSYWVRLFLGEFFSPGSPLDLFLTGAVTIGLLELSGAAAAALPRASVPRLFRLVLGAATLPAALLFALSIPLASFRMYAGWPLVTSLFLGALVLLLLLVQGRSGFRLVRAVDPWI